VVRRPIVAWLLIALFAFGAAMTLLTAIILTWPGTPLDVVWRINPRARGQLGQVKAIPILFGLLSPVFALAAVGVARARRWAWWLSLALIGTNLVGDVVESLRSAEYLKLVGILPTSAILVWLSTRRARAYFGVVTS
jgi:hypothetical protein